MIKCTCINENYMIHYINTNDKNDDKKYNYIKKWWPTEHVNPGM